MSEQANELLFRVIAGPNKGAELFLRAGATTVGAGADDITVLAFNRL